MLSNSSVISFKTLIISPSNDNFMIMLNVHYSRTHQIFFFVHYYWCRIHQVLVLCIIKIIPEKYNVKVFMFGMANE